MSSPLDLTRYRLDKHAYHLATLRENIKLAAEHQTLIADSLRVFEPSSLVAAHLMCASMLADLADSLNVLDLSDYYLPEDSAE